MEWFIIIHCRCILPELLYIFISEMYTRYFRYRKLISKIDELHGLSNRNIGAAHAILLHKTETTRSAWWRKFNTGESISPSSCCRLTAHFPALWLKFQPPGNSREIVNVPGLYVSGKTRELVAEISKVAVLKSRYLISYNDITRLSRLPDRPQLSAHSRFFLLRQKTGREGAPDVLFRQCYSAGSRVKVPRYFRSPKERPALAISHIIVSHYAAFVLLRRNRYCCAHIFVSLWTIDLILPTC